MIRGVHHVAVTTRQLDRLADFYREAFGFEVVRRSGWRQGTARTDGLVGLRDSAADVLLLRAGNTYLELFDYLAPPGREADPDRPVCDAGYTHFCVEVTDIDAEYDRLLALGMRFHRPPTKADPSRGNLRTTYGRDPEGNVIELLELLDEPAVPPLSRLGPGSGDDAG